MPRTATIDAVKLKDIAELPPWEWPGNTSDKIKKMMRDHGAPEPDRKLAVEMAGNMTVIDNEISGLLIGVLIDQTEPEMLRSRAAVSLGPVLEQIDNNHRRIWQHMQVSTVLSAREFTLSQH